MNENASETNVVRIERFQDLRGLDLSNRNLRNVSVDVLITTDFDTETKWPNQDRLPIDFNPETVLENGKNSGLGLKEIHKQGITGRGINVAIIDQELDVNHPEYSGNIASCERFGEVAIEGVSMHGPAVSSLFVGKNCGVAPEARLHYKAVPAGDFSSWEFYSEGLEKIINNNIKVGDKDRIRVVSCSIGYPNPEIKGNSNNWQKTIEKAINAGIIFIDSNTFYDLNFTGGGSVSDKEDINTYGAWLALDESEKVGDKSRIIIPSDYRTVASSWKKNNEYSFYGRGGFSWSIPYLLPRFPNTLNIC